MILWFHGIVWPRCSTCILLCWRITAMKILSPAGVLSQSLKHLPPKHMHISWTNHPVAWASSNVCRRIQLHKKKENGLKEGPNEDKASFPCEDHAQREEPCCDVLFMNSEPARTYFCMVISFIGAARNHACRSQKCALPWTSLNLMWQGRAPFQA